MNPAASNGRRRAEGHRIARIPEGQASAWRDGEERMDLEIQRESERLGARYRRALKGCEESLVFWNGLGSGQAVSFTAADVLSEGWPPPTPDEASRQAMAELDGWREFRAAHGMP
jgi:hypothetical protein